MATTVNDFNLTLISVSTDLAAFESRFQAAFVETRKAIEKKKGPFGKRIRLLTEQPYFHCFHNICSAICFELRARGVNEEIELLFDEHDLWAPRVQEWYPIYLLALRPEEARIMPKQPLFRDDKKFLPLQIADFAAWIIRSEVSALPHPFGPIQSEMRVAVSAYSQCWNENKFEEFLALDFSQPLGDDAYEGRLVDLLGLGEIS